MSSEPDITEVAMTPSDRFIFCACDGLHDVIIRRNYGIYLRTDAQKKRNVFNFKELYTYDRGSRVERQCFSLCIEISWLHQDDSMSGHVSSAPILKINLQGFADGQDHAYVELPSYFLKQYE